MQELFVLEKKVVKLSFLKKRKNHMPIGGIIYV
jgi:hypothetical protein